MAGGVGGSFGSELGAPAGVAVGAGAGCCTAGAGCGGSGTAVVTGCAAACG